MQKKSLGRQKIEMVKMKKDSNLQVTFSKRRSGLFKKASELCTLCGAQVGIIVFSPGNKVFSFGHPGIGTVIDRYLNRNPPEPSGTLQLIEAHRNANVRELNLQLTELLNQLEHEKNRGEELKRMRKASQNLRWWEAPIEELSLPQLLQLKSAMEEMKINVAKQAEKLAFQSTNSQQFFMGASSSGGVFHNYNANMMPQRYSHAPSMMPPAYNPKPEGYNPGPPELGRGFF
ncbi:hypothetical protein DITRI_Ditri08aG0158500 [Diplodiscus trichospermus]